MRAGLLRELVSFEEELKAVTPSGSYEKTYRPVLTCKAYRRKLSAVLGKEVNAREEFISDTILLQVRQYPVINENQRVIYAGKAYKIKLLDPQHDRTYLITCTKINE